MQHNLLDLMINRIPGLKAEEKIELVKNFDKEKDFSALSKNDIEKLLGRCLNKQSWNIAEIRKTAEKDAGLVNKLGMRLVSWRENVFPPLLREIFDPPVLLFYRGVLPDPEKPLAAVVGTRKPSPQAAVRAFALGKELGELGIPLVSGLALGIDSLAHRGNIEAGAPTVAVLGSSPDMVYPASNRNLARRILETGGAILSEYPPETRPMKWHYPARNRIISGMARGTVIVEAPEKSGALITGRFALEQGRDLWVDSVSLASAQGAGAARFAEDGAAVISSAKEILAEWKISGKNSNSGKCGKEKAVQGNKAGLASSMAEYLDIEL